MPLRNTEYHIIFSSTAVRFYDRTGRASLGEDHPGSPINELTNRVEVTGVTGGLGHYVQNDIAHVFVPPVGPPILGPPFRWGIQGCAGDGCRALSS